MSGWFAVKRGITVHPIFKGRPDRLAVWIWLLDNACWKDTEHDVRGKIVVVPRGSVCVSERRLAAETGVGRKAIRVFFELLSSAHMVAQDTNHGRTIITLCNYDKYQTVIKDREPQEEPLSGPKRAQRGPTKEQGYNTTSSSSLRSEEDARADFDDFDPAKVVFNAGVKLLRDAGRSEAQSRAVIGKWRKDHPDEAIIVAIGRAKREGAIDPVSFIEGALRFTAKKAAEPEYGDIRHLKSGQKQVFMGPFTGWLNENT